MIIPNCETHKTWEQKGSVCFNSLPHTHNFQQPCLMGLLKTLWEKEKMPVTSIFFFSHNVFYPIKDRYHHLGNNQFVVCKCFQFGRGQDFVIWQRVKIAMVSKPMYRLFLQSVDNFGNVIVTDRLISLVILI